MQTKYAKNMTGHARFSKVEPILAVALWCSVIGAGMAFAALGAMEPPVWDALSYVQKGYKFWHAVGAGKIFNPFALPMTVRPPGTILMSYPFGWSDDFHWFYFRSCFIPITLLIGSVYIAGWSRQLTRFGHWALAALALTLVGMPILYQFQNNDQLAAAVNWGLVDGFLAGICGIAVASAARGVAERSIGWSAFAAIAGGFSLWIKPSGLALMALVGLAWLILLGSSLGWRLAEIRRDAVLRRFVCVSLAIAILIFGIATDLAFRSDYFSAENIGFGRRVLVILKTEFNSTISAPLVNALLRVSIGYPVLIFTLFGFLAAARSRHSSGRVIAALLCILVGLWFLVAETDIGQIRYFLPFCVMASILLLPPLLTWMEGLNTAVAYAAVGAAVTPTLIITALLLSYDPSDRWQSAMGINLHVNDYRAENEQAANFLNQLRVEGASSATVYFTDTTPVLRNLVAVWENRRVTEQPGPQIAALIPIDWLRATTVRAEDLLHADIVAAEFVRDEATRKVILAQRQVPDFPTLARLFNAWVSGLNEADGISVISETRARLVRIDDRGKFDSALARLEADHDMPQAYRDANPQRWWTAAEFAARGPSPLANITFHRLADPTTALSLRGAEVTQTNAGLQAAFWFEPTAPDVLGDGWYIFGHLVDQNGNVLANAQTNLITSSGPSPKKSIHYYVFYYPSRPPGAVALAFGIFKLRQQDSDFLIVDQETHDWEGRRFIAPLTNSQ